MKISLKIRKNIKLSLCLVIISLISINAVGEPLHEAIQAGDLAKARQLIEAGADVNAIASIKKGGMTPLNYAAYGGHLELVTLLLDKGADVNQRDQMSFNPLLIAAINGHQDVQKLLVKRGADVNAAERSFGWTALHRAAANGHNDLVIIFLEKGAAVNAKTKKGETPLNIARQKGKTEVAELLKSHGGHE